MRHDNDPTDDTTNDQTERESLARRNLLRWGGVAAAGAAAGAIAAAVNASPAAAAAGDPMIVGDPNDAGEGTTEHDAASPPVCLSSRTLAPVARDPNARTKRGRRIECSSKR